MKSPLAVVLDEDPSVREEVRALLVKAGIETVPVATPLEAAEVLRARPHAIVVAIPAGATIATRVAQIAIVCRLAAEQPSGVPGLRVDGRSRAADGLRRRMRDLASLSIPVLFVGEEGSGRSHAARCLHAMSSDSSSFFVAAAADEAALGAVRNEAGGAVFLPSIETAAWSVQDRLAKRITSGPGGLRVMASTTSGPGTSVGGARLAPSLTAAFEEGVVRVPPLRERREDIAELARIFLEELRLLNGLQATAIADDAIDALLSYPWPGNVGQLRGAIESALIVAEDGRLRASDLPGYLRGARDPAVAADQRFRDAKRTVVEAFERSYLEDLLRRHGGNVTGAAEQSGMLRSALQRLLRKHELHSVDFRRRGGPDRYAS